MSEYSLTINGLDITANYPDCDVQNVYLPLLRKLTDLQKKKNERLIVFLAAPPGSGKSTLGLFLENLSKKDDSLTDVQVLGIDGFHRYGKDLQHIPYGDNLTLKDMKGIPESFDIDSLYDKIIALKSEDVFWPLYDRRIHDPLPDAIHVDSDIVLIEGNYLLYSKGKWSQLRDHCDYSIFMNISYDTLTERLISRKVKGGSSQKAAEDHFHLVDGPNIKTVLENRLPCDMEIIYNENNEITEVREDV
ncbi:MAG: nucleoside/nucleotide kinase family protein [Erysipelotrichaceae bacterium]|nr:nucleoside/nucleotide kinase family protein [Erysipelotrichaceae bacterium]